MTKNENGNPENFLLYQNFPNPFNPLTTIKYAIPSISFVALAIYDILGNLVAELVHKEQSAGYYNINFDASSLPSGVYFYRLECGNYISTKKLILLK